MKRRQSFLVKAYNCNKIVLYRQNDIRLKESPARAHLNWSVGPYTKVMFRSFDRGIGFCTVYNQRETCIVSEINIQMRMRSKKNEEDLH